MVECSQHEDCKSICKARLILGTAQNASPDEISHAYKILTKIFHPDRFVQDDPEVAKMATNIQVKINEALSALRNKHSQANPLVGSSKINTKEPVKEHKPNISAHTQNKQKNIDGQSIELIISEKLYFYVVSKQGFLDFHKLIKHWDGGTELFIKEFIFLGFL